MAVSAKQQKAYDDAKIWEKLIVSWLLEHGVPAKHTSDDYRGAPDITLPNGKTIEVKAPTKFGKEPLEVDGVKAPVKMGRTLLYVIVNKENPTLSLWIPTTGWETWKIVERTNKVTGNKFEAWVQPRSAFRPLLTLPFELGKHLH